VEVKTLRDALFASAIAASVSCVAFVQPVHAAPLADLDAEVVANVWEENDAQFASVSVNGKEILAFKANMDNHAAEEKAEDIADKLKDLVQDEKFDANKLLPAKEGDVAVVKFDGATVMKLETSQMADGANGGNATALEQSLKVVNAIRVAMGVPALPASYIKFNEVINTQVSKANGSSFSGHASWYGGKFHGRKTSDGTRYNQDGLTAAHRWLPFGTKLLVRNRKTGDSCVVEVNDRGPFVDGRVIDLSRGAARQLNMLSSGVALVDVLVLGNNETAN
jgi:rare lipoprotein A